MVRARNSGPKGCGFQSPSEILFFKSGVGSAQREHSLSKAVVEHDLVWPPHWMGDRFVLGFARGFPSSQILCRHNTQQNVFRMRL